MILQPWPIWGPTWSRRHKLNGNMFRLEIFIFGLLAVAIPYFSSNLFAGANGVTFWDPEIALDRQIPVIGWMIAPYMALYLYYPAVLIFNQPDDRSRLEMIAGIQMLSALTIFCSFFFVFFPAEIDMRSDIPQSILEGDGWQSTLFATIHAMDQPFNAWPSLHIVHSYFLGRVVTRWVLQAWPRSNIAKVFVGVIWIEYILLCISILTTKQHYLFDLATGLILAIFAWQFILPIMEQIANLPDNRLDLNYGSDK